MADISLFDPASIAQQSSLTAVTPDRSMFSPQTLGTPSAFSGPAISPTPGAPTTFSQRMSTAGSEADSKLGDDKVTGACATCRFPVKLEHRSRYTAMTKYSKQEWVAAKDLIFLIGQDRELSVRVAEPKSAVATWEVTPIGNHSGTLAPNKGTGNRFDYTPKVTNAQRPITPSRSPNKPVKYQIRATVTMNGQTQEIVETIEQDERDIIRNEFVDFRTWRHGFKLHVPYRNRIVEASRPDLRGNYVLVLDSHMTQLLNATAAHYSGKIVVTSGWRNPRRNLAAGSTAVNSNHQHGGAVDMAPDNSHTAKGATRRGSFAKLYNAALQAGGRLVVLEAGATVLYPGNRPIPALKDGQQDADDDGIPDGTSTVSAFNLADHVHIDLDPPNESEDD
jgi:hypothetical protein